MPAVVFDLGGTHLRSALADDSGRIDRIEKKRIKSFIDGHRPADIWQELISSIVRFESSVKSDIPSDAPIVLSFPGPIAHPSRILSAPTLVGEGTSIPDLGSELTEVTGRPVHFLNDLSAAAWYLSEDVKNSRFMVVTISSGIGSKIFDRHSFRKVLDDVPYAGEIGHVAVDSMYDAILCDCGGRGHLGGIASGRGIERFARRMAEQDARGFAGSACVLKFGASANTLTNEDHLVPAAALGDPWALDVIRTCSRPLAKVLLSVVLAAGVEKVIIIGGFALALGEIYLDLIRTELIAACDYEVMADYVQELVAMGNVKDEACLKGAAIYARSLGAQP
jgi:predicted NBD/HSP70 family sugar kinase